MNAQWSDERNRLAVQRMGYLHDSIAFSTTKRLNLYMGLHEICSIEHKSKMIAGNVNFVGIFPVGKIFAY